ncbi:MAG: alkaline phosphatase family protein [Fimbriimonadaceae bacterium]|nr:alkaline phosphatase family protein [Fimbriimonadaceae bacterium]
MRRLRIATLLGGLGFAALALSQPHPKLNAGPMNAYVEMTEAAVWVQTTGDAEAAIRYWPKSAPGQVRTTPTIRTDARGDHIALFRISGLEFGTRYAYDLLLDGERVPRDYPTEFQTQPHWRWRTDPPEFTFAFGSCLYVNEERFDRPGRPYGGDYETLLAVAAKKPDFMVWLGDNVYYREPDWLTEAGMRYRWRHDRALPELQPLLGGTQHYFTWDDHDFGPDDSDRSYRLKGEAARIFMDYCPGVRYGTPETPGMFSRFEWGDVEFFVLDDRYHRSPNNAPDGPDKTMLGRAQLQWLKDALVSSGATFKVVVNGGQMLNPLALYEGFGRFESERKDLFDYLAARNVTGLIFLSGDRHVGELIKVRWPGASYDWYDFTSSPLTAGPGRDPREENNPARVPGTWVTQMRNFGLVRVSGKRNERKLTLTAHDKTGKELWRHEIPQSALAPAK